MPRNFSELKNGGTIPMLSPQVKKCPTDRRPSVYHLQFRAGICAVHVTGAVATREVKTYNFTARLRPFPRFAETISQGVLAQRGC